MIFSAYLYLLVLAVSLLWVVQEYYYGFGCESLAGLRL